MMKREKIIYSLFFIVTVALASTVAFLCVNLQGSQSSLEREQAGLIAAKTYNVYSDIERIGSNFYGFYWKIQDDNYQLAQGYISNVTRDALYERTIGDHFYGDYEAQFYKRTIENDLNGLAYSSTEQSYKACQNVSDTVQYALDQIDFALLGRTENDSRRLISELYYLLGIDQETQSGNWTALRGIEESFFEMYIYWERQSGSLSASATNMAEPSALLEWALGNATLLYQDLVDWHNSNLRATR